MNIVLTFSKTLNLIWTFLNLINCDEPWFPSVQPETNQFKTRQNKHRWASTNSKQWWFFFQYPKDCLHWLVARRSNLDSQVYYKDVFMDGENQKKKIEPMDSLPLHWNTTCHLSSIESLCRNNQTKGTRSESLGELHTRAIFHHVIIEMCDFYFEIILLHNKVTWSALQVMMT